MALKTVGLLTLMGQAGLHVPVTKGQSSTFFPMCLPILEREQSIEQNLSTFSSHMANIVRILDEADENCLILLDELGTSTDPEGRSAMALLQWFH